MLVCTNVCNEGICQRNSLMSYSCICFYTALESGTAIPTQSQRKVQTRVGLRTVLQACSKVKQNQYTISKNIAAANAPRDVGAHRCALKNCATLWPHSLAWLNTATLVFVALGSEIVTVPVETYFNIFACMHIYLPFKLHLQTLANLRNRCNHRSAITRMYRIQWRREAMEAVASGRPSKGGAAC